MAINQKAKRLLNPNTEKREISKVKLRKELENLPKAKMPVNIIPMLATLTDKPFNSKNWVFEIKWDGYRAIAYINNGETALISRKLIPFERYPIVSEELRKIKYNCVLDGEVVAVDNNGVSHFQLLQNYMTNPKVSLRYYIFDILWIDGRNTMDLLLIKRKELLRTIIPDSEIIFFSEHYPEKGIKIYKTAQKLGLEGLVGKLANSTYMPGIRTQNWLKIKTEMRQEVIICGFTEPRGSRKYFGALILGLYDDEGKLRYAGHTGTGFNYETLKSTYELLQKYIMDKSPFDFRVKTNQPVTWIKPKLVCEIKFSNWTGDNHMRHPVFMGLRFDKSPKEVKKES